MSLTNYLENALLDHIRGGAAFTQPTSLHVKLHTGSPGEDGTANPATEATRKTATFSAASAGSMALDNGPLEWSSLPATETFSHFSIWDAGSSGNPLGYGSLSSSAVMNTGETFRITALTWSLD
jgi:hypothetical protein